jgi:hypothetical protein
MINLGWRLEVLDDVQQQARAKLALSLPASNLPCCTVGQYGDCVGFVLLSGGQLQCHRQLASDPARTGEHRDSATTACLPAADDAQLLWSPPPTTTRQLACWGNPKGAPSQRHRQVGGCSAHCVHGSNRSSTATMPIGALDDTRAPSICLISGRRRQPVMSAARDCVHAL